jgi:hypothetical protein
MVTVACVQVGNYCGCGAAYVNKLRAGVLRHLPRPHRFACITDDASGLDPLIDIVPAHPGLTGWWQKLALFKPGTFQTGRIIFFDLDTWILGDLTPLANYAGDFAMLEHLMRRNRPASGVLAWHRDAAGAQAIWEATLATGGEPRHKMGDQGFMEDTLKKRGIVPDLLQHSIGGIYSWKLHCRTQMPADVAVCCFHMRPKPHELPGWSPAR